MTLPNVFSQVPDRAPEDHGRESYGFAIVDLETTGLDASADRIVEIAVIRADRLGRPLDEWSTLVDPGGRVGLSRVHGITTAKVRNAPTLSEVIGEINARLARRAIVAHNAAFDLEFLAHEYRRLGWDFPPTAPFLCTLQASLIYQPRLRRRRLRDCCRAPGLTVGRLHSALADARAVTELLSSYLQRAEPAHHRLPADARLVEWPPIPLSRARIRPRQSPSPASTAGGR